MPERWTYDVDARRCVDETIERACLEILTRERKGCMGATDLASLGCKRRATQLAGVQISANVRPHSSLKVNSVAHGNARHDSN